MNEYKGCIVEESLTDNRILNNLKVVKIRITSEENADDRWHIYDSIVSKDEIDKFYEHLKQGWYMHFWKGNEMIILFKGKKFVVDVDDKDTWKDAIDYGLFIDIPKEQLDFVRGF